jgi:hypothetical protein
MIVGLPKRSFAVAAAATGVAYVGAGGLYSLNVTAVAAAATFRLYDQAAGPVATNPIAVVRLAANGVRQVPFPKPVRFSLGLLVAAADGDVSGSVVIGSSGAATPRFFSGDGTLLSAGTSVDALLLAETAGAAAEATVFDNTAAAGNPFVRVPLAANETAFYAWPNGVAFGTGITVDEVSGAVEGVLYTS